MKRPEPDLETLFAAAREQTPAPSGRLVARVLADAAREQNVACHPAPDLHRARTGIWAQLLQALGGWPGLGGLAAASAAGIWLGFAPPAALPDPAALVQERVAAATELDLLGTGALALALAEED